LAEAEWGRDDLRLIPVLRLLAAAVRTGRYRDVDTKPLPYLVRALAIARGSPDSPDSTIGDLHYQAGLAFKRAGRLEDARDELACALTIFDNDGATGRVALALGALGRELVEFDPAAALPHLRRLVEMESRSQPNSIAHYLALQQLGDCFLRLGDRVAALQALGQAREMLVNATHGAEHRWLAEIEELIEKARALVTDVTE
jgi:tetratricopeptide (TPR) repeat protein